MEPKVKNLVIVVNFSGIKMTTKNSIPLIYIYENGNVEERIVVD